MAFLDGCVTTFQNAYGPIFLENRLGEYNVYVEDNWRITPSLTVNLGLRYEYVKAPTEKEDRIDYGMKDDTNNVEPRVGFAWSPSATGGLMKWVTGGAGQRLGARRIRASITAASSSRCSRRAAPASGPTRHTPSRAPRRRRPPS